ncbi:MAG TPA: cation diffusion facilitator family transporter [Spirochaetia bacterium]|nr:cation diffusion facilitator family transporter [Spirochaetia bacterium]
MNRAARTARLSILSNAVLIAMKLAVGLVSGSVSIISEAIHSFMDLVAALMAFVSIRLARRPADKEHPYGHEKIENVSGVIEAILIFAAVCLIITEAVRKLLHNEPVQRLELGLLVMVLSGAVNALVSRRLYRVAAEEASVALEADALHLKTDVYSSLGVGAGLLVIVALERLARITWASYLDPVVAIAIAVVILKESWSMLRKAFGPLVDTSLSPQEVTAIVECVKRYPNVGIHSLRTRSAGGKKHIDFHLSVPESISVRQSHDICDDIERDLTRLMPNASVLIHVEPRPSGRERSARASRKGRSER